MVTPTAKLPPHDEEVEKAVLGCILLDGDCLAQPIAKRLSEKSFYCVEHKAIYTAAVSTFSNTGHSDVITVSVELKATNKLEQARGLGYLAELPDKTPTVFIFAQYSAILLTFQQQRAALSASVKLGELAVTDLSAAAKEIENLHEVFRLTSPIQSSDKPMQRLVKSATNRYEDAMENRGQMGVMTGFTDFDKRTGGLKPGTMTVVAAETNGGKSTFALNIANFVATNSKSVLFYSLEMSEDEITDILFAMNARISRNLFNTGDFTQGDIEKLTAHTSRLTNIPFHIRDTASPTSDQIEADAADLAVGGNLKLVVVDYVQIIEARDQKASREQQVAQIARAMRGMAKRLNVALILLSQLNDEGKLRESRVVAHEAHNVIILENDQQTRRMKAKIVKGRSIPRFDWEMSFEPEYSRLTNISPINRSDYEQP